MRWLSLVKRKVMYHATKNNYLVKTLQFYPTKNVGFYSPFWVLHFGRSLEVVVGIQSLDWRLDEPLEPPKATRANSTTSPSSNTPPPQSRYETRQPNWERMRKWMIEWMNEWLNQFAGEWLHDWIHSWMVKPIQRRKKISMTLYHSPLTGYDVYSSNVNPHLMLICILPYIRFYGISIFCLWRKGEANCW